MLVLFGCFVSIVHLIIIDSFLRCKGRTADRSLFALQKVFYVYDVLVELQLYSSC